MAAGAGAIIGGAGAAALGSATGIAVIGSLIGIAGAGLTGRYPATTAAARSASPSSRLAKRPFQKAAKKVDAEGRHWACLSSATATETRRAFGFCYQSTDGGLEDHFQSSDLCCYK